MVSPVESNPRILKPFAQARLSLGSGAKVLAMEMELTPGAQHDRREPSSGVAVAEIRGPLNSFGGMPMA